MIEEEGCEGSSCRKSVTDHAVGYLCRSLRGALQRQPARLVRWWRCDRSRPYTGKGSLKVVRESQHVEAVCSDVMRCELKAISQKKARVYWKKRLVGSVNAMQARDREEKLHQEIQ